MMFLLFSITSTDYLNMIKDSFSILTALVAISATLYVFSNSLIERSIDDDRLLMKLLGEIKRKQFYRLLFSVGFYLIPLAFILIHFYFDEFLPIVYYVIQVIVILDVFVNIITIFFSMSIKHDMNKITKTYLENSKDEIRSLLEELATKRNCDLENIEDEINEWYEDDSWKKITLDVFIHRFTGLEQILKFYEVADNPRRFEEDFEKQLIERYSNENHKQREAYISKITPPDTLSWKDIDNSTYAKIFVVLSQFRDLLHYIIPNKMEKKISDNDKHQLMILFNTFMFLTFRNYLSFVNVSNYQNHNGKFKDSYFCESGFNDALIQSGLFRDSHLIRCKFKNSSINNSVFDNTSWDGSIFEEMEIVNTDYKKATLQDCMFETCNFSFDEYVDCVINSCFINNAICQNLRFTNTTLESNSITNFNVRGIELENTYLNNTHLVNCNIEKFKIVAKNTKLMLLDDWISNVINAAHDEYEQQIYHKFLQSEDISINIEYCLESIDLLKIWNYIAQNAIVTIKGTCFRNSALLNSDVIDMANLSESNFTESNFDAIRIERSNLEGIDASKCKFQNAIIKYASAKESTISNSNFYNSQWNVVSFYDTVLSRVNATNAEFVLVSFNQANCDFMTWANAKPSYCSFAFTQLISSDWSNVVLKQCIFKSSVLRNSIFPNSTITNCEYRFCNLNEVRMYKSNFSHCVFEHNSFENTIIQNTIFDNCEFIGNSFKNCIIDKVEIRNCTIKNPTKTMERILRKSKLENVKIVGRKGSYIRKLLHV